MILLGSSITGEEAESCGLVAGLFEPGTVLENALESVTRIANMSRSAVSLAKECICRGEFAPLESAGGQGSDTRAKPTTRGAMMTSNDTSTTTRSELGTKAKGYRHSWVSDLQSGSSANPVNMGS